MLSKIKIFFSEYKTYQWIAGIVISLIFSVISIYYFSSYSTSKVYNVNFDNIVTSHENGENIMELTGISIPKGSYTMSIAYITNLPCKFLAAIDNENVISQTWENTNGEIVTNTYTFELKTGTDRGRLTFTSDDIDPVNLAYINIVSESHIYKDGIIWGVLALLMIPATWIAIYFFGRSGHKMALLTTLGLILVQVLPFILTKGLIQGVDTRAHMMRIEGIYYGLLDGQFPVIVQPEWNNSYGQIGVLYPNVFLYVPALFRCMGMSQLGVAKLFLFIIVVTSGIIAFAAARTIFKRDWQVTLCVFAIMIDNMRIHDLMSGGRIGGSLLAEMFWPLLIAGFIEVFFRNRNKWYLLAFGIAGTFCCHVTSASVACILVVLMTLFSINKLKEISVQKAIGRAILLFIGLTLGTVACFVQFYFTEWGQDNLQWCDFLTTLWNIGNAFKDNRWTSVILVMLICLVLMVIIRIIDGKEVLRSLTIENYILPLFVSSAILLWMSTSYFPWRVLYRIPGVEYYTNMLQNGYRFLSLASCGFAFCLPELLEQCVHHVEGRRSFRSRSVIVVSIILIILACTNIGSEGKKYLLADDQVMLYEDEVIGNVEYEFEDYLPKGTKSEWYWNDTGYISDENNVESLAYEREGTYIYYSYTSKNEGAYVEFPKFYYNGYVAENEMGDKIDVYKGDKNRVRVYLTKSDQAKVIRLWYYVPWYLTLACSISIALWLVSVLLLNSRVLKKIK